MLMRLFYDFHTPCNCRRHDIIEIKVIAERRRATKGFLVGETHEMVIKLAMRQR